ncbi:MAG TPA: 4-amino-4-deoxychorismate lyase, partial [Propionibacteriaceae bacterium]|nr:4-amino-4-deoxychorismate lyase [Propionibacteriaceae bacterium]
TRELIMEWSSVEERDLSLDEAKRADEVFLTSSMRDVQAVGRWDDRDLGPTRPVTQALAINFAERSEADIDP